MCLSRCIKVNFLLINYHLIICDAPYNGCVNVYILLQKLLHVLQRMHFLHVHLLSLLFSSIFFCNCLFSAFSLFIIPTASFTELATILPLTFILSISAYFMFVSKLFLCIFSCALFLLYCILLSGTLVAFVWTFLLFSYYLLF